MRRYQTTVETDTESLTLTLEEDSRLRKYARWTLKADTIQVRVPPGMTRHQVDKLVDQISRRVTRQRKRAARRTDLNLMERATQINTDYFDSELSWHTIRWVANMKNRLGSCTTGGTTDGDIRISERIRDWPAYVVDYVIAHEICHRKYPNHSPEFWAYLSRYPHTQKALGFIEGITYADGQNPDALLD